MKIRKLVERQDNKIVMENWVAILTFIILLFTTIVSIVSLTVSANSELEKQGVQLIECKDNINILASNLAENKNRIVVIETHYVNIKEQLDRIETKVEEKLQ